MWRLVWIALVIVMIFCLIPKQNKKPQFDKVMRSNEYMFETIQKIVERSGQPPEGNCFWEHATVTKRPELINKQRNLFYLGSNANHVMEIGFNAGHSSLLFLLANPHSKLVVFDICEYAYIKPCFEYINMMFPGRITLICGDSMKTVPEYASQNPHVRFDLIHVDGYHEENHVRKEIMNVLPLLNRTANRLILDDDQDNLLHKVHREYVNSGTLSIVVDPNILKTTFYEHLVTTYNGNL